MAEARQGFRAARARKRLSTEEADGGQFFHEQRLLSKRIWTGDRRCSAETTRGAGDKRRCSRCPSVRAACLEAEQ
ncbi:MAG: hypothetical protein ACK56F_16635, partial [bacterium]